MRMWIIDMLSNLCMGNDYDYDAAQQVQQQMDQEMQHQQMQQQMDQDIAEMNDPYIHPGLDICVDESYHGIDHGGLQDYPEDITDQYGIDGIGNEDFANADGMSCNDDWSHDDDQCSTDDWSCDDDQFGTDDWSNDDCWDDNGLDCSFDDWSCGDDW